MKRLLFVFLSLAAFELSFSSCATIVGGAKYNARVRVPDHPNAKISINGMYRGNGEASTLVDRKACDMINITVQEGDDEPQTSVFSGKRFRTGTLIADILAFFPGGIIIDAITGAWWRPDEREMGVSRIDVDNYLYTITYRPNEKKSNTTNPPVSVPVPQTPAATTVSEPTVTPPTISPTQPLTKSKTEALRELKQLLDEGVLTQEEYDKEKAKLLESN